ncbi:MAG: OmpA family protein [Pseudomonadales bacterium]|nr:OmpA family protein [Pseudomonadales bacterium]
MAGFLAMALCFFAGLHSSSAFAAPAGDVLTNRAFLNYAGAATPLESSVDVTVEAAPPPPVPQPPTSIVYSCATEPGCSGQYVFENAPGATIATLSVVDPDQASGHALSVVSDPRFIVVGTSLRLAAGVAIDFEQENSVPVAIRATDADGLSLTQVFVIAVRDVNEAPFALSLSNNYVASGSAGSRIGSLSASDVDDGDVISFSVSDARFVIDSGNFLALAPGVSLGENVDVPINVTASDTGGLSTSVAVTITTNPDHTVSNPTPSQLTLSSPDPAGTSTVFSTPACSIDTASSSTYSVPALPGSLAVGTAEAYAVGDVILVTVIDEDQNLNPLVRETVTAIVSSASTSDQDTVTLTETAENTGRFEGYLHTTPDASALEDCLLSVRSQGDVQASYTDPNDSTDVSTGEIGIGPVSLVFDDVTGEPLDGVILTLVDMATGKPALAYGDGPDFARYPAVVKSGEAVRDQSGNLYNLGPGEYRFPAVPAGNYKIQIFNTRGFHNSALTDGELQALTPSSSNALTVTSSGRYVLGDASRSLPFHVAQGAMPRIDIPVRVMPRDVSPTSSSIEILQYSGVAGVGEPVNVQQTSCVAGQERSVVELKDVPVPVPGIVNLVATTAIKAGQPIFIRVTDNDQNEDPNVRERISVQLDVPDSGDREYLELTETEPDSGQFVGYVQSVEGDTEVGSCSLGVVKNESIQTTYTDAFDNTDVSESFVLVDPFGVLFSTHDGTPIDGVSVTLVDASTGQPAQVFGDGPQFAAYPSTIVTGDRASDAAGMQYDFPPGEYRFPFVAPGHYRLVLDNVPAGYIFPSTVDVSTIASLPGAPYQVVPGSHGEAFEVPVGPALNIDIPVDVPSAEMFLTKSASKDVAAIGDFVQYKLDVRNRAGTIPAGSRVVDTLPTGFRYRKGSLRIDGGRAGDPAIAADGRTLTIDLPLQSPDAVSISYVTEITVGTPKQAAINSATVTGDLVASSNVASARVMVTDDLFRDKAILMGRVTLGNCDDQPGEPAQGLRGVRLFLEDGSFVVTDENGAWHMEGIEPGTHVVQLDLDSLPDRYEASACNANTRFAGSPHSQFVDVAGGTLWRADFRIAQKPDPVSTVKLTQTVSLDKEGVWVSVLAANDGDVSVREGQVIYSIPTGWQIVPGSGVVDGSPVSPSQSVVGSVWPMGEIPRKKELRFRIQPVPGKKTNGGEAETENRLFVMRPRFDTRSATLKAEDKRDLDRLIAIWREGDWDEITIVGHTDNVPIAPWHRDEYRNNGELSYSRALAVTRYIADRVDIPRINVVGAWDKYPVASNDTSEGRTLNRRVEFLLKANVHPASPRQMAPELFEQDSVARLSFSSAGSPKGKTPQNRLPLRQLSGSMTKVSTVVEARATGSWDIDVPAGGDQLAVRDPNVQGLINIHDGSRLSRAISAVKADLDSRLRPELILDGKPITADRIGFKLEDTQTGKTLYSYVGVDFGAPGTHTLTFKGTDPFGNVRYEETAKIVRVGELYDVKVLDTTGNVADGTTPVRVRLALLDKDGERINVPHKLILESSSLSRFDRELGLSELSRVEDHDYVEVDGEGILKFNPVSHSGVYHAKLKYEEFEREVEIFVAPEQRDWIMVGLAEGTVAWRDLAGNVRSLDDAGLSETFEAGGKTAFYAKGQVKGDYILTMAYDTSKKSKDELGRVIDPDTYYTVYGDKTTTQYDAASREKLYLKLERNQFYALFGDFSTGLSVTELSNYSRTLTGLKTEFENEKFGVNAFVSSADQAFVKDEIRGDGTSGLYRLSSRGILTNSEEIHIETRDRFHSEEIVDRRSMQRHLDYDIDYDRGTIFFKEPIYSQDTAFNPVFIVVDYEVKGDGKNRINAGGRFAYRPIEGMEFGATLIREGVMNRTANLAGLDYSQEIGDATKIRAEIATTRNETDTDDVKGFAWLAEIVHRKGKIDARAYAREQEDSFGLGQQNASESGTRKVGVEGKYDVSEHVEVRSEAYRQTNLGSGANEDVVSSSVELSGDRYNATAGLRRASSETGGESQVSSQLLAGGTYKMLDGRLALNANADTPVGGNSAVNFPKRLRVGLDYRLSENVTLKAEQEFTWGEDADTQGTRIGMVSRLWDGAELSTSVEQQAGQDSAERLAAVTGLKQRWEFNDKWRFDFGVDRSQTLRKRDAPPLTVRAVYSSPGNDDFTSVTFGSRFRHDAWDWSTRVEYRTADSENKVNLLSDVIHDLDEGQQLLASVDYQKSDGDDASRATTDIRFGYSYRPLDSRWTVLNRLDLSRSASQSAGYDVLTQKIVNNLNANYLLREDTQLALQYGAKYVVDNFDSDQYRGFTDLYGMEIRHDMGSRWDVGMQGSYLTSHGADVSDSSYGVSIGYNMAKNVWMSLGYNFRGFDDADFRASEYTAEGIFLKYRVKFDQFTAKSILDRIND